MNMPRPWNCALKCPYDSKQSRVLHASLIFIYPSVLIYISLIFIFYFLRNEYQKNCRVQIYKITIFRSFLITASFSSWEERTQQLQLCLEFDNYFSWSLSEKSSPFLLGTLRYQWNGIQRSTERTASIGTSLESASFLCKRIWSDACAITVSRKSKINGDITQKMLHIWPSTV